MYIAITCGGYHAFIMLHIQIVHYHTLRSILSISVFSVMLRSFDRSRCRRRHCADVHSKQCDTVSRTLIVECAEQTKIAYLRSICRLLSFPSWQLCPIPWSVTMQATRHEYAMANCCNIHGTSLPSILMAVSVGFDLCLMPIYNIKNGMEILISGLQ